MIDIAVIKNLVFKKNEKEILNIPQLNIPKNKIISLVGPSGAGKTTLLNILAGIEKTNKTEVTLFNNMSTAEIGFIFQENFLYDEISVFHNIYLSAKNSFVWKKQNRIFFLEDFFIKHQIKSKNLCICFKKYKDNLIDKKEKKIFVKLYFKLFFYLLFNKPKFALKELIFQCRIKNFFNRDLKCIAEKVEITEILKHKAQNISGGQKQRVLITKAIIKNSQLILMDEPFSALDIKIKEKTIEWILKIKKEFNLSIILVTHDQNDALKISDYILVMREGKIEQFDTKDNILENPATYFVANFFCSPRLNVLEETEEYKKFIKPRDITIKPTNKTTSWKIIKKDNVADVTIYKISNGTTYYITVNINNKMNVGDYVDLEINSEKVLKFKNEEIENQYQ
ncbi:glycerol ABC transporter ATP-binding protein [Mycoplasmopsis mustelae]|uniref:Glycerol ABC transporter ATP-binding protein n=1 Tax=Mycoplasmopsis mustelae TaxID=171289 RepID=A0A4R7UFX7_9BACT|nr:ABC transporter ATP-binding protein [Mycoplasmopsis mustelae]TDV24505.1 glycerol ABC transporter ATP-binding protein [Mycoplasmopsis mustelae]